MAPGVLSGSSSGARRELCRRCCEQRLTHPSRQQARHLGLKVIAKRQMAAEDWNIKAENIKAGKERNLWDILQERGYVKDVAGTSKGIRELMRIKRIGAYVGIDPTAKSLHVGHLVPLMASFWMYIHGYRVHTIIGGATAKIGDPTGRLKEREGLIDGELSANITKAHYQVKHIWASVDSYARRFGYEKEWAWTRGLQNNSTWYSSTPFTEVLARMFSGIRLSTMLSRDTVKKRLDGGEGMSLAEFVYPLVQAWDWWHLYSCPLNFQMQIGGSDQYGNIVTGIEVINHIRSTHPDPRCRYDNRLEHSPVGFTTPLLTDSSGAKFGKSAGNAVWLDPFMTSSYDLYGYFMRRPDADVEQLLCLLTFLPMDRIKELMRAQAEDPKKRPAQHALAHEVVGLVHSGNAATEAKNQHEAMHGKPEPSELSTYPESGPASTDKAVNFQAEIELPESLIMSDGVARILFAAGLVSSVTEGHRIAMSQGAYVGGAPGINASVNPGMTPGHLTWTPVKTWFPSDTKNFLVGGNLLFLRRGKHFVRIVKMVSDEEWRQSGRSYPGEPYKGKARQLFNALKEATPDGEKKLTRNNAHQLKNQLMDLTEDREAKAQEDDETSGDMDLWNKTVGDQQAKDTKPAPEAPTRTYRFNKPPPPARGKRLMDQESLKKVALYKQAFTELRAMGLEQSKPSVKNKIKEVQKRLRQEASDAEAASGQGKSEEFGW